MKKITLIISFITLVLAPKLASMQVPQTPEQIDAYYDAQIQQAESDTDVKNKAIMSQLEIDLKAVDDKYKQIETESLKQILGDDYDFYISILPENNPNPRDHTKYLLKVPREYALRYIRNISLVNQTLASQIQEIFDREYVEVPMPSIKTTTNIKVPEASVVFKELDGLEDTYKSAEYFSKLKTADRVLYDKVFDIAQKNYFSTTTDPEKMFNYMDSLTLDDASKINSKLKIFNPDLQKQVDVIAKLKYPNGKEAYLKSLKATTTTEVGNKSKTPWWKKILNWFL